MNHALESWVVLALLILIGFGALKLLVQWLVSGRDRSVYQAVPLLTPAETVFYRSLVELYGTVAVVCPKVRLGDLIRPQRGMDSKRYWSALNRVTSKHVDFVLLRPEDLTVIGVIELDDRSHERQDRADRDQFVDEALRQGGIPICHIKNRRQYDLNDLCQQLNAAFAPPEEKTP